jgi:hypothetical protein
MSLDSAIHHINAIKIFEAQKKGTWKASQLFPKEQFFFLWQRTVSSSNIKIMGKDIYIGYLIQL